MTNAAATPQTYGDRKRAASRGRAGVARPCQRRLFALLLVVSARIRFFRAEFRRAGFRHTEFRCTGFRHTEFRRAEFRRTEFRRTVFRRAEFRSHRGDRWVSACAAARG
jgi:uncharacterized protein YjbI with pentapeptide repeats